MLHSKLMSNIDLWGKSIYGNQNETDFSVITPPPQKKSSLKIIVLSNFAMVECW